MRKPLVILGLCLLLFPLFGGEALGVRPYGFLGQVQAPMDPVVDSAMPPPPSRTWDNRPVPEDVLDAERLVEDYADAPFETPEERKERLIREHLERLRSKHNIQGLQLFFKQMWLWFILLLIFIMLVEYIHSRYVAGQWTYIVDVATLLTMGANVSRKSWNFWTLARFVSCTLLHLHLFHLFANCSNIVAAAAVFAGGAGQKQEYVWVYYWILPVQIFGAMLGSVLSALTTLRKQFTLSVGASGGCLAVVVNIVLVAAIVERFQFFSAGRLFNLLCLVFAVIVSVVPIDKYLSGGGVEMTDYGAHIAGSVVGAVFCPIMLGMYYTLGSDILLEIGKWLSVASLCIIAVAIITVLLENLIRAKRLRSECDRLLLSVETQLKKKASEAEANLQAVEQRLEASDANEGLNEATKKKETLLITAPTPPG